MKEAGDVPLGVEYLLSLLKSTSSSRRVSIPMAVIITLGLPLYIADLALWKISRVNSPGQ